MPKVNSTSTPARLAITHIKLTLNLFAAHYRHSPLQAAAILIGIVLAVTLFVAVQAINLNAKRSYAESAVAWP